MELKHSVVDRGGVSANLWSGSTEAISASTSPNGNIGLRFVLPSKGGGKTDILLTLDAKDLRRLLRQLAKDSPNMARVFADCTLLALKALPMHGVSQSDDA